MKKIVIMSGILLLGTYCFGQDSKNNNQYDNNNVSKYFKQKNVQTDTSRVDSVSLFKNRRKFAVKRVNSTFFNQQFNKEQQEMRSFSPQDTAKVIKLIPINSKEQ